MLLPFQGVITFRHVNPGCRCACPGLCAPLGFYWHHRLRLSNSSKLDCIRLARWFSPPLLNPNPCQTTSRSSACPAARIVNDFSVASTKLSSLLGHLVKTCQLLQFISPKSVKQSPMGHIGTGQAMRHPGYRVLEQSRPERAKALRHGAGVEQNIHTMFHIKTAKSVVK